MNAKCHQPATIKRRQTAFFYSPRGSPGPPLPVRAVRSSRRDAVNVDIGFYAQDGLVLALGRHLDSTVIDGSCGCGCVCVCLCVRVTHLFFSEAGCAWARVCNET